MIIQELIQNTAKFDNFNLNKLLAYTAIINSLNYKWYKSSKRRFLLPNFYFTRSFYNFYKIFFLKNTIRRRFQVNNNYSLFNVSCFFEKKMFLKRVNVEDFFNTSNSYFLFLNSKNSSFFNKDRFFFKKLNNNVFSNSNLIVSNSINIDLDSSVKLNLFKKNLNIFNSSVDFNVLIFFYIFNECLVEFYKTFVLLNLNVTLNNSKFF